MTERKLIYKGKIVASNDIEKHLRNKDNFVIIAGDSGLGKTTFMRTVSRSLKNQYPDKIRIFKATKDILT